MIKPKFSYLLSLFLVFVLPASGAAYFVWDLIPLINLAMFAVAITILGSIWDIWATRHGKRDPIWLWQFNLRDTLGIQLFGIPIEEYLFYVSSSLYVVFIWEGIKRALETQSILMYIVLPLLGVWSLLFILIPSFFRRK